MTKHKPKFLTDLYFRKKVKQPGRHSRHARHEPLGNDQASPVLVQQQVLHAEVPLDLPRQPKNQTKETLDGFADNEQ